ncbi:VOC family protein [Nonomuraea mesophila]|uniref:VOC family protein n=1 Tax=Nonomuraea mesophila TaxID=2530382 RepID=A0A4R5E4W5_9ACTN|nr:VOC family protein [Nonomuraea mesophila]TDE24065.1 VOC family protein [Nonomuraea mesophila]
MTRTSRPVRTSTNLRLSSCTLAVHDLDQALGFYRDLLGFEARPAVGPEPGRWASVGPPSQPDVHLLLEPPGTRPGVTPGDRRAIENLLAKGLLGHLVFVTDDCAATFERMAAAGAEVMQEPIDRPGGVRDCAFLDPSGNLLRFVQR